MIVKDTLAFDSVCSCCISGIDALLREFSLIRSLFLFKP